MRIKWNQARLVETSLYLYSFQNQSAATLTDAGGRIAEHDDKNTEHHFKSDTSKPSKLSP